MDSEGTRLELTPDGGPLRTHASGLVIIRRRKHEPIAGMLGSSRLPWLTDKVRGSKFLPHWTLEHYVNWLEEFLTIAQWGPSPGSPRQQTVTFVEPTGISAGKTVYSICVRSDGQHVHAYPVETPP